MVDFHNIFWENLEMKVQFLVEMHDGYIWSCVVAEAQDRQSKGCWSNTVQRPTLRIFILAQSFTGPASKINTYK